MLYSGLQDYVFWGFIKEVLGFHSGGFGIVTVSTIIHCMGYDLC